jgi:hypothetical protein
VCRCLRDHAGRFFFMEYPQAAVVIMPLQPILQVRQALPHSEEQKLIQAHRGC